jgi:hypothetical protein
MTNPTAASSPRCKAGLAGVCYLLTIGVGAFDHLLVGGKLIARQDAAATAHNILASAPLYRLAFALDLIPVYLVVTVLFYDLFKPVNRSLSLLAAFSSLIGGAVGSACAVFQIAPLAVLGGEPYLRSFDPQQLQALALLLLKLHDLGFAVSLVFFGFYCFLLGCLILASAFAPRAVGVLMAAGGLAYMTYSFTSFISPPLATRLSSPALLLGSLGEIALTLWLLAAPSPWTARRV